MTAAQRDAHAKNMDSIALPYADNVVVLAVQTHSCQIYQMTMTQTQNYKQRTRQELTWGVPWGKQRTDQGSMLGKKEKKLKKQKQNKSFVFSFQVFSFQVRGQSKSSIAITHFYCVSL